MVYIITSHAEARHCNGVAVISRCFSDMNPFAAAHLGARVLNVVPDPRHRVVDADDPADIAGRVLSLVVRRVVSLMEVVHRQVRRDVVCVRPANALARDA